MNLYKLRYLHNFEATREEDYIVVENGSLKSRKTIGTYKDFGKCQWGLLGGFLELYAGCQHFV